MSAGSGSVTVPTDCPVVAAHSHGSFQMVTTVDNINPP